jgi:phage-related holin
MLIRVIYEKCNNIIENVTKGFVFIYLIFEEVNTILLSVLVLITIDQITGVWKACSLRQFKWKVFSKLYAKIILYMIVLIATFIYETYIIGINSHYFTKGLAAIIGFQELSSTYLNISIITGTDFLSSYLKKFRNGSSKKGD